MPKTRYNAPRSQPVRGSLAMIPHHFYYHLMVLGLLWFCVMLHYVWPSQCAGTPPKSATLIKPPRQRPKEPKLFAGLTYRPPCALCEHAATQPPPLPPEPPAPMPLT